jgi:hypothetical protein
MKRLMGSLLGALPDLANVVVFLMFVFILFGILGVQQFVGGLYWRCRYNDKPDDNGVWAIDYSITRLCTGSGEG